ncbi:MAG: SpoIVB peptidase [Ruminococcaceae bacterium]|nr:SpoIVB peptidase [Oscillospiraceae bacterium]
MQFKKVLLPFCLIALTLTTPVLAENKEVIITGQGIGITLNSEGAMVTETAKIETNDNRTVSPAETGGMRKGDVITEINGEKIKSVSDLHRVLSKTKEKAVMARVKRNGNEIPLKLKPVLASDGEYRLGVWAKDATTGIGTLTYYEPQSGSFGALGHGICDSASGKLVEIEGGEISRATMVALNKGEKGRPGELQGIFSDADKPIGTIEKNTCCGIFGKIELPQEEIQNSQSIKVGTKADVRVGKAYILANIEGEKTEKFEVEIIDIPAFTGDITKGMVIKITDKRLLEKTGGIVRGMSGSPIVQSGRLVGAVTHVFVNDPTQGYGIFIENMLAEAEN